MQSEERLVLEFLARVATLSCLDQQFAHGKIDFCVLVATAGKNRLGVEVEVKASFFSGHAHLSGPLQRLWGAQI